MENPTPQNVIYDDDFIQRLHPSLRPGAVVNVHNSDLRDSITQPVIEEPIFVSPCHQTVSYPSLPEEAQIIPYQRIDELSPMVQSEQMRSILPASHTHQLNLRKMQEDMSGDIQKESPVIVSSGPSDKKAAIQVPVPVDTLPAEKRGQKKVKHAEYKVHIKPIPNLSWKLVPTLKTVTPTNCSMFTDKLPHMWAKDEEDVISAIQTHPDIFKTDGIGMEGSCLNYLILSGTGWQNIEWVNPYVMLARRQKVTKRLRSFRKEYSNPPKRVRFEDPQNLEDKFLTVDIITSDPANTMQTQVEEEQALSSHHDYQLFPKLQEQGRDHLEHHSNIHNRSDIEVSPGFPEEHICGLPNVSVFQGPTFDHRYDGPKGTRTYNDFQPGHDILDISFEGDHGEPSLNNHSQVITQDFTSQLQPIIANPEYMPHTLESESPCVEPVTDSTALPEESQYFQTALKTRHPISIFARNDLSFAKGSVSTSWTYAFMGFFVVTDFKNYSITENEDTGTTELYVTFKWVGNGSLCDKPNPWWFSGVPTLENRMGVFNEISDRDRAICSSLTCFSHIALYPKREEPCNEDVTVECNDDFFENVLCWLCTICGKLNAIVPFRWRWSWTCRYCKNAGRSIQDMSFQPVIFQDAYHLPPPLPVKDPKSPTDHSIQFFKASEQAIIYRFKSSNTLLQHIPTTDGDTHEVHESLYCTIQQRVDFIPCDNERSLLRFDYPSPGVSQTDISFLTMIFDDFIKNRPGLIDNPNCLVEPHGVRCAFWPSKGTSTPQSLLNQHVLFIALGSTCDLTFAIQDSGSKKKKKDTLTLVMPHGGMLFFHHHDKGTVTYKVSRTDRLLLLTCYWDDVVQGESTSNDSLTTSPKPVADSAAESTDVPLNEPSHSLNDLNDNEMDHVTEADRLKERGNESFKAKRYGEAIDFYTRAIDLRPTEPTYLTNRAACSMALKMFRPALADCQAAANLQSSSPSPKTLLRLAKCHLALGAPNPALSAVREAMAIDSGNGAIKDVELAALRLEAHLTRCLAARSNRQWGLARLALDQAARECEGSEPIEWRCWRIEIELARGKLEPAMLAANDAFQIDRLSPEVLCLRGLVMFLSAKLPSALQHLQQALSLDPENTRARKLLRRIKDVERIKEEGNVLFKSGDMTGAIAKYTEALVVVGEEEEEARGGAIRATLLSNRATALLKIDRRDEALADTETSLTLVPTSYKALRTRARINMSMEDYQAAVRDFKASMEQVRADGSQAEERALKQELKEAEIALKRSKTKDYYKILGLSKTCTDIEIKKAYRKQSLLHHPDKGGDEEKFKLASEAYNVLSDPQKRSRYDAGEDDNDMSGMGGMNEADLADIFASFGGGGFTFGSGHGGTRYHTSPGFSF